MNRIHLKAKPKPDDAKYLLFFFNTITSLPATIYQLSLNSSGVNGLGLNVSLVCLYLWQVTVNLYSAHMDPDDWQLPQQFRPERFLDHSGNVIGRDRIIPFGLGELITASFVSVFYLA